MEFTKLEAAMVEKTVVEVVEQQVRELNELQLALVGGGGGAVVIIG
jgi:hypothetical protein